MVLKVPHIVIFCCPVVMLYFERSLANGWQRQRIRKNREVLFLSKNWVKLFVLRNQNIICVVFVLICVLIVVGK